MSQNEQSKPKKLAVIVLVAVLLSSLGGYVYWLNSADVNEPPLKVETTFETNAQGERVFSLRLTNTSRSTLRILMSRVTFLEDELFRSINTVKSENLFNRDLKGQEEMVWKFEDPGWRSPWRNSVLYIPKDIVYFTKLYINHYGGQYLTSRLNKKYYMLKTRFAHGDWISPIQEAGQSE